MRLQLCEALIENSKKSDMVFLTGDLGFMALEPLQLELADKFINAGIAEQNMISVAAALAKKDFSVWVYSISPFIYARAFEQIRNDIAFHKLPVKLIGNGGGYGYGVMGPTHHAIEDYGILLTLPHLRVFIPVFDEDVISVVTLSNKSNCPVYLRMGRGEPPKDYNVPEYAPWRQLVSGKGAVVIAVGPLAGKYISDFESLPYETRPNLWAVSELPIQKSVIPDELFKQIEDAEKLVLVEEHVQQGGFGVGFIFFLTQHGVSFPQVFHFCAKAHHYSSYGSQNFLRTLSCLNVESIIKVLKE